MRAAFWVVSLAIIATYLFLYAFGAFTVDEVLPVSIAVAVLTALWTAHALHDGRTRRGI